MLKKGSYLLLLSLSFLLVSCSPKQSDIVVASYGDREIKMREFEDAYAKSAGGYQIAEKDSISKLKNFLDLYVNFKMKLRDAEVRGYQDNPDLQAELIDYKKRVGVSYLLEKQIIDPGIKDLYNKRKWELRVSHLMIRPDSTGLEGARKQAQLILDSIKAGASFEDMTRKYSQDMYSKPLAGDLYYITGGMLPAEFEDAMYKAEPGKVYPEVVVTKYGAHIIKVTEKHERVPQIRASHILVDFNNDEGKIDTVAARARIDSIAAMIKEGTPFKTLAEKYSEDGTKQEGGDLGYFERRNMVREFDEAAFKLNVNEVSDVIRTQFGYHLIMVTDKKLYPAFEEDKENLKKIFRQARYQDEYDAFIDTLKKKYNFTENTETLLALVNVNDSVKVGSEFKESKLNDSTLYSYDGKNVTAKEFLDELNKQQEFVNKPVTYDLLRTAATKMESSQLLENEAVNLEKSDAQFASLMDDYRNGIYIFKLQEDEVWNKISLDSTKLYQHYLDTKEKYIWPNRVDFSELFSRKDSLIQHYYSLLQQGENFDSLAFRYTERPGYKDKAGKYGLVDIKSSPLAQEADKLANPGDYSQPFKVSGGSSIVRLNGREASRLKTFEEAKAEVSGSFQESESKRLEQVYVDSLKKKYHPEINYDALKEAFPQKQDGQTSMEMSDKASN